MTSPTRERWTPHRPQTRRSLAERLDAHAAYGLIILVLSAVSLVGWRLGGTLEETSARLLPILARVADAPQGLSAAVLYAHDPTGTGPIPDATWASAIDEAGRTAATPVAGRFLTSPPLFAWAARPLAGLDPDVVVIGAALVTALLLYGAVVALARWCGGASITPLRACGLGIAVALLPVVRSGEILGTMAVPAFALVTSVVLLVEAARERTSREGLARGTLLGAGVCAGVATTLTPIAGAMVLGWLLSRRTWVSAGVAVATAAAIGVGSLALTSGETMMRWATIAWRTDTVGTSADVSLQGALTRWAAGVEGTTRELVVPQGIAVGILAAGLFAVGLTLSVVWWLPDPDRVRWAGPLGLAAGLAAAPVLAAPDAVLLLIVVAATVQVLARARMDIPGVDMPGVSAAVKPRTRSAVAGRHADGEVGENGNGAAKGFRGADGCNRPVTFRSLRCIVFILVGLSIAITLMPGILSGQSAVFPAPAWLLEAGLVIATIAAALSQSRNRQSTDS